MTAYAALLRGVNIGNAKRVPMAELQALLGGLGYDRVSTLLNSGNAVFHAAKGPPATHAAQIARALSAKFGFDVPVVVKSLRDLQAIVHENSLAGSAPDHSRLFTVFAQEGKALEGLASLAGLLGPSERFLIGKHAAYLHCPDGLLASRAGEALMGRAGNAVTTRNWATVLKLFSRAGEGTP
jgi:uncharacterized protein (DUF1697 family)